MKKIIFILFIFTVYISCKNDNKSNSINSETSKKNDDLTLLKGNFIFYGDAAVLQTQSEIYGVFVTEKMKELDEMVKKYKTKPTDMVPIEIKGRITKEKHDKILWENKVEIVEILKISQSKQNDNTITLGQ